MTRLKLGTLVAVALGVLTVGAAVPAAAVPPQIMRIHLEDQTLTFTDVCDFPFQIVFNVDLTITRFVDQEGNLTRRVVHVRETNAVFTNLHTGKSVAEQVWGVFRQMSPDVLSLSDEVTVAGLFFHLTLRGEGSVVLDAGRFILDLTTGELTFEAGPKPFAPRNWPVLCPVLS